MRSCRKREGNGQRSTKASCTAKRRPHPRRCLRRYYLQVAVIRPSRAPENRTRQTEAQLLLNHSIKARCDRRFKSPAKTVEISWWVWIPICGNSMSSECAWRRLRYPLLLRDNAPPKPKARDRGQSDVTPLWRWKNLILAWRSASRTTLSRAKAKKVTPSAAW